MVTPQPLGLSYKGEPVQAFQIPVSQASTSTTIVNVSGYNAVHVEAYLLASSASFDLILEGSNSASGVFITLSDPNASTAGVTANKAYNVLVGSAYVRVRVANVSGTFATGQGVQVYVTPYVAGGTNTFSNTVSANQNLAQVNGSTINLGQTVMASSLPVAIASNQGNVPMNLAQVGSSAIALGSTTASNSVPVVIASNQNALAVYSANGTSTHTVTAVAQATTTILAANTARKGATIYNDATAHVHVKLGSGATTTDFTRVLAAVATNAGGYWEVPFGYTGIITAYLGASGTGNWRVAEIT
jgi:hypothetical protein